MELKVRAVDGAEEKSVAQVEEQLLEEHQEKVDQEATQEEEPVETQAVEEDKAPSSELNDERFSASSVRKARAPPPPAHCRRAHFG